MKVSLLRILVITLLFPVMLCSAGDSSQRPSAGSRQQGKVARVVIDAGHGGIDPGTNFGKVLEKDITLSIALKLGALIERNLPDVQVVYTRTTDVYVKLIERSNIANKFNADLFISIHVNASDKNPEATGTSTFVMGYDKSGANLNLAMKENEVIKYEANFETTYEGFKADDPASYIIFQLMQFANQDQSMMLAEIIQKHYAKDIPLRDRGAFHEGFLVLWRTTMPSVLTEFGFMTNKGDRAYVSSEKGQNAAARSLFNAFSEYKSRVEGRSSMVQLQVQQEQPVPVQGSQTSQSGQQVWQAGQETQAQGAGQNTARTTQQGAMTGQSTSQHTAATHLVSQGNTGAQSASQGTQVSVSGQTPPPKPPDPIAVIDNAFAGKGGDNSQQGSVQGEYSQAKIRTTLPDISSFFSEEDKKQSGQTGVQSTGASAQQGAATQGSGQVTQPAAPASQGQRPSGVMKGTLTDQAGRQSANHSSGGQQATDQQSYSQEEVSFRSGTTQSTPKTETPPSSIIYYVQVSALKSPKSINSPDFKSYRGKVAEKYVPGGSYGYKYLLGGGSSYDEAARLLTQARREFPDAFMIAFDGDEQIAATEARKRQRAGR